MPNAPMDLYRLLADDRLTPEQKRAQFDAMYGPATPVAPAPDARLAQFVDPNAAAAAGSSMVADSSQMPPAPPPMVSDAGPPPMSTGPAMSVPPPPPEANMSLAPPMSMGAATPEPPPPPPPPPSPEDQAAGVLGNLTLRAMRGSPGVVVPAHDQPVSTTVQTEAPAPEDLKEAHAASQDAEQGLALQAGDTQAANKEAEAEQLDKTAFNAEVDRNAYQFAQTAAQKKIKSLQDEYDKVEKDTAINPGDWWASKTTGQKIVTGLAAILMGIGGDPDAIDRWQKQDLDLKAARRNTKLSAVRQRMEDLKSQMQDPNAARAMELAMSNRVSAAEMDRLAASSQSAEIRDRAAQISQALRTQATQYEIDAWKREHGAQMQTQIAHVPARVVGGSPGGLQGLAAAAKATGEKPADLLKYAAGGGLDGLTPEQKKDALSRRVEVPGAGSFYAARPEDAQKLGEGVRIGTDLINNYNKLEQMIKKDPTGRTWDRKALAKMRALFSANTLSLAVSNNLGAISDGDKEIMNPLVGSGAGDTISMDAATLAGIQQAREFVQNRINTQLSTIYRVPFPSLTGPAPTGGTSAADLGARPAH